MRYSKAGIVVNRGQGVSRHLNPSIHNVQSQFSDRPERSWKVGRPNPIYWNRAGGDRVSESRRREGLRLQPADLKWTSNTDDSQYQLLQVALDNHILHRAHCDL